VLASRLCAYFTYKWQPLALVYHISPEMERGERNLVLYNIAARLERWQKANDERLWKLIVS
jgi:hypothetical protein